MRTSLRQRIALSMVAASIALTALAGAAFASNSYTSSLYFQGGMSGSPRYYGASGCGCDGYQTINISYTMYVASNPKNATTNRTWSVTVSHDWSTGWWSGSDLIGVANGQPYNGYTSTSFKMVGNGTYHFGFAKPYDGVVLESDNVHMWSNG